MDGPHFWKNAAELFITLRCIPHKPESIVEGNLTAGERWSQDLCSALELCISPTSEGGLLYEVISDKERHVLDEIQKTLRPRIAQMVGTMSHREKSNWYREMLVQILNAYLIASSSEQHPLLGTAMFLFDVWTFTPVAGPGKATQQSLFAMRFLLKTGLQLAVESAARQLSKGQGSRSVKRKIAQRKIALAHAFITVLYELPRTIAGPCMEMWDEKAEAWKGELVISWGEMALRLLKSASTCISIIEEVQEVDRKDSVVVIVSVLAELRKVRNGYGPAFALADSLSNYSMDLKVGGAAPDGSLITMDLEVQADSAEARPSTQRTPAQDFQNIMSCLIGHLQYRNIVSTEKIEIVTALSNALFIKGDSGTEPLDAALFRRKAVEVLRTLEVWLKLDTETIDQDLQDLGVPLYALFLHDDVIRSGSVSKNSRVKDVLERIDSKKMPENAFLSDDALLKYYGLDTISAGKSSRRDPFIALALHFFPITDPGVQRKLERLLLHQDIRIDTFLQLLSDSNIALIPEESFGSVRELRNTVSFEATRLVARIPQIMLAQAISEAGRKSRPLLRMVSNAVTKILVWGFSRGSSVDSLREMLLELHSDMLPPLIRPLVSLPVVDMLNGDTGVVTLVRADIGETMKREQMRAMINSLACSSGMYVNGLSEAESVQIVDVMENLSELDTTMTHSSKLDTLVNEQRLMEQSARVTRSLCRQNGIKASTTDYLITLIRAIYRARWLYNNANFVRYRFEPDAQLEVPGHVAARGMCLLMECRNTISKYHSSAVRAVLLVCAAAAKWDKQKFQKGEFPDLRDAFRFRWVANKNAKSRGFIEPTKLKDVLGILFRDLERLINPLANEWDQDRPSYEDISAPLSHDVSLFEKLRDQARSTLRKPSADLNTVGDAGTGLDKVIDGICDLHIKLNPLRDLLKPFFKEIVACSLRRETLTVLLKKISQTALTIHGKQLHGPSEGQIRTLVTQIVPENSQKWPQFGSVAKMVNFVIERSFLKEKADAAFKVLPGKEAHARLTPAQALDRARDSLQKCFTGDHTGRDYAFNVIFPLVRLLNDRWGTFGNIQLMPQLLIRDLIADEIKRKQEDNLTPKTFDNQRNGIINGADKVGTFPTFDLYGANASRGEDLIHACKSLLFRRHSSAQMKENAEAVGTWLCSIMRFHQCIVHAINEAQDDEDDIERLLEMCISMHPRQNDRVIDVDNQCMPILDEIFVNACKMVGGMVVARGSESIIRSSLAKLSNMLISLRGFEVRLRNEDHPTVDEFFLIARTAEKITISAEPGTPIAHIIGNVQKTALITDLGDSQLAENSALCMMIGTVLAHVWVNPYDQKWIEKYRSLPDNDPNGQQRFALLVSILRERIDQIVIICRLMGDDDMEEPEASSEGFAFRRLAVLFHRCILSYLWWYLYMRHFKFAWLKKVVYRMPQWQRESDIFSQFPTIQTHANKETTTSSRNLFTGQFGILQYVRRVGHLAFNLKQSGLQRAVLEVPTIVGKLMELQRGFEVDIMTDRHPEEPEIVRTSPPQRALLVDTFAVDMMHVHGVLKPMIDCIYLNRQLLTGTGLQSPAAFAKEYMKLAQALISPSLSIIPRADPDLTPPVRGTVMRASRGRNVEDAMSMSGSLASHFELGDNTSGLFSTGSGAGSSIADDARSVGSMGSVGSTQVRSSSKRDLDVKYHPAMQFIPFAGKLYCALSYTLDDVYTWEIFEKTVRALTVESIFRACGVQLESPFVNLPIDTRLRKIVESTMHMALAEERGNDARDSALKLSTLSGQLLGLDGNLIDGMLAVVDKLSLIHI